MDNENQNHDEGHEGDGAVDQGQQPQEKQFTPSQPTMQEPTLEPESSPMGPIIGIIVVVILIVLAGFYFWGSSLQKVEAPEDAVTEEVIEEDLTGGVEEVVVNEEPTTEVGAPLSGSDEIEALEQDLDSTDLDNLDAELEEIDEELTF